MMYAPGGPAIGGTFAVGTTVPADATIGYAPGCIFIDRDAGAGSNLWVNQGSVSSSLFKPISSKSNIVTAITTLTVTKPLHEGKTILLSLAGGFTSTLPLATGSGDKYKFVIGVVPTTSSTYVINAAGSDVIKGALPVTKAGAGTDYSTANTAFSFNLATAVTVTIGGTNSPKGGAAIGDWVLFEDIASAVWGITGVLTAATTPTTPFS